MVRTIVSVIIILAAAFVGIFVGSAINESETFCLLFAIVAGFACTIHAVESKKGK